MTLSMATLTLLRHRLQVESIRQNSIHHNNSGTPSASRGFHTTDKLARAREVSGFPVLDDPLINNHTIPSFMVGTENGFLPSKDPMEVLPKEYEALEQLLQQMPLTLKDGTPGLLAK